MATKKDNTNRNVSYEDGLSYAAGILNNRQSIKTGSFEEFVRNIWSQSESFTEPDWFNSWHISFITQEAERALSDGKNYLAVLPRGHLKSTVLCYAFSVWKFLNAKIDTSIFYLSFSDGMSQWHLGEMNKHIRSNPQLMEWMIDRSPNSEYAFNYLVNGRRMRIDHGGIFTFKRGMHINGALICDDLLRDPENPLNLTVINKVEEFYYKEVTRIPNPGAPTMMVGTPMIPGDLLFKIQEDERFVSRVLPALDPVPGHRVLFPMRHTLEGLLSEKEAHPKSFASEMMLSPALSSEAYFNDEDIYSVEDDKLKSVRDNKKYDIDADWIVAGMDVGKKRHPSHISVFKIKDDQVIQIFQKWLDGWDYNRQVQYLNELAENLNIDRGYIDSSNGVLDERGLNSNIWYMISFTHKRKQEMAANFEEYIQSGKIKLIKDERQHSQICCVDNDLKAPQTPLGHGDSFFSNSCALLAASEYQSTRTQEVGNLQDLAEISTEGITKSPTINYNSSISTLDSCPQCGESAGWIPQNNLCLICYSSSIELPKYERT